MIGIDQVMSKVTEYLILMRKKEMISFSTA